MFEGLQNQLEPVLIENLEEAEFQWLSNSIDDIVSSKNSRQLYIAYSLCANKIRNKDLTYAEALNSDIREYLEIQGAKTIEIGRLWLLISVLRRESDLEVYVKKIIEVADNEELETFLKYLAFLPNPRNFQFAGVEALRTNISTVFEAISSYNPYPALYFSEQQWNQMYLKAAFMQLDLSKIVGIDDRANQSLARIISDYAHERWAASRSIDPYFWRPVSNFLEGELIEDIKRLLQSKDEKERLAATLVCQNSNLEVGKQLLEAYTESNIHIGNTLVSWNTLKKLK